MNSESDILRFFNYEHLPSDLQVVSRPFAELACAMVVGDVAFGPPLAASQEREFALRKLLEAKDCAVRAALISPNRNAPQY